MLCETNFIEEIRPDFAKCVFLERIFLLKQNQKFNNLDRNCYDSCWHILLLKKFIKHSESVFRYIKYNNIDKHQNFILSC